MVGFYGYAMVGNSTDRLSCDEVHTLLITLRVGVLHLVCYDVSGVPKSILWSPSERVSSLFVFLL